MKKFAVLSMVGLVSMTLLGTAAHVVNPLQILVFVQQLKGQTFGALHFIALFTTGRISRCENSWAMICSKPNCRSIWSRSESEPANKPTLPFCPRRKRPITDTALSLSPR